MIDRRRPVLDGDLVSRVALAWLLAALLALAMGWSGLSALQPIGPDDGLRLVQVRDLYAGQSWFDMTQARVDAPSGGISLHWSRLVDLPLLAVIAAITPIAGERIAEQAALAIVPLLTLFLVLLLAARIASRMTGGRMEGTKAILPTCLALVAASPIFAQLRVLRIDHHGWQIVLALLALNGLTARDARRGGVVVGIAMAAWLAISVEGLPLAAAFLAIAGWRWLRDPDEGALLLSATATFAGASVAIYLGTRGFGDLSTACDAIGPGHLAAFAIAGAGCWWAVWEEPGSRFRRIVWLGGIAIAALVPLATSAPQCVGGGFAGIDPLVRERWLDQVAEGLPLWRRGPGEILLNTVPVLLALWGGAKLAGRSHGWLRAFWVEYVLLLCAAFVVGLLVSRAGAVALAFSAPVLGWLVAGWIETLRTAHLARRRLTAIAGMAAALAPALPFTLLSLGSPAIASFEREDGVVLQACTGDYSELAAHIGTGEEVLTPLDLGPILLLETRGTVIATAHHRGDKAIRAQIDIMEAQPGTARRLLAERGTAWVAACRAHYELFDHGQYAPGSLAARLRAGAAPEWLEPVVAPVDAGTPALWRIRPE